MELVHGISNQVLLFGGFVSAFLVFFISRMFHSYARYKLAHGIMERAQVIGREMREDVENDLEHICSICLEDLNNLLWVQSTCAHNFCAPCIIDYWRRNNHRQIACPMCRRPIEALLREQGDDRHGLD